MSVMSSSLPIGAHGGEVMYFGSFCFGGELGFQNCDDMLLYTHSMTLASGGGSPIFLRRGLSTNPGVTMWCVCGCR